jgi:hypothetical protein
MARNGDILWDWHVFQGAMSFGGERRIWSRYPVELAPDLIVCPHLFDWPADAPQGSDVYTCAGHPHAAVFCARGEEALRFLTEDVAPRVLEHVPFVGLIDADRSAFDFAPPRPPSRWLDIEHLSPLLRMAYGERVFVSEPSFRFDRSPDNEGQRAIFGPPRGAAGDAASVEAHPARLWEAFFWRGHSYRYELIGGEVPLIGDLLTPLGANRTLLQLVRDAEALEGQRATETAGWLSCGHFRMRQIGRLVDVRVGLDAPDRRIAFLPQSTGVGALPSLVGALLAGGHKGKTELWNGWTWATVELSSVAEREAFVRACQATVERWVGAPVELVDDEAFEPPKESSDAWFIAGHEQWATVYVPFHRHRCLPWDVMTGDWQHRQR